MKRHWLSCLLIVILARQVVAAEPSHNLVSLDKPPAGLSADLKAAIGSAGHRIEGPDGPVCDIWLLSEIAVKPDFSPTLSVNYPFTPGQLVGALRVPDGSKFTDFRGQELKPGVYTLRYGQQPEDGNHIGTSDLADFLLALPAKTDQNANAIDGFDELTTRSAKSAGTTHPAIFSLLPIEEETEKAELSHDEDYEYWILSVTGRGKSGEKSVKVQLRLVTIGQSEA